MKEYRIEVCANGAESALNAQRGGAFRVELCAGMPEGGTTPSAGEILAARRLLDRTRLNVIIRPRGGDFLYSDLETAIMMEDIRTARIAGADGVVFGCLTPDGEVDIPRMEVLMETAAGMEVTFHRAFDMCRDPFRAMDELIDLGCDRILTSGQRNTAPEGAGLLAELVRRAEGRIVIMPGSGITAENVRDLADRTGAVEFHLSGRAPVESTMKWRNPEVSMGGTVRIDEFSHNITSIGRISAVLEALA